MNSGENVQVRTLLLENRRWGIVCCCCGQRIPKDAPMAAEVRNDGNRAETGWFYTRHYLHCPSSARPHGFNVDLAHAVIELTDDLGTFRLDKVVASRSGRRASTLTLSEMVRTCTESLWLIGGGPHGEGGGSSGSGYDRQLRVGSIPHQRVRAAATDPASFLEDVATEASWSAAGGESQRNVRLRIMRAVCEATVEALLLGPFPTNHLLTANPGGLVVLPLPPAVEGAVSDGATPARHLAASPAARLLDTRPPPPPPACGEVVAEEDKTNLLFFAEKGSTARKALQTDPMATCNNQGPSERGKLRIAKGSEKRRLA